MLRRLWSWLWSPAQRWTRGTVFLLGAAAGVVFWGGFNTFMEYTNTMEFCVSCHEMRATVLEEYKKTVHYNNPAGVRAICSDCHVPREWTPKLIRKVKATSELYHKIAGTIDTPEKFEAKRLEMAESVWRSMEETDSRECRNCHSFAAMDFHEQSRRAREKMQDAAEKGKTCIECHKGIAHELPAEYEEDD